MLHGSSVRQAIKFSLNAHLFRVKKTLIVLSDRGSKEIVKLGKFILKETSIVMVDYCIIMAGL
jgi:hypothetical protein